MTNSYANGIINYVKKAGRAISRPSIVNLDGFWIALAFSVSVFCYPVCFRQVFDAPREDPES